VKVVVTGAGGMLGRDVLRASRRAGHDVAGFTHAELDITDPLALRDAFEAERPAAVVNCAAWTDVDGAEADEAGATRVNGEGAGHVAAAAAAVGARVVHPSSDYVFDGSKTEPYVESDPTGPISAYGRSKLAGEQMTADANRMHQIVRSAWLFGAGGRNFVETMLSLARDRDEIRVVRDQVGSPTYTAHLAVAIVRLLEDEAYGIHHLAGGGQCSWYEFAVEIFEQARVDCRVTPCTTEEFPRPAPRPAYSVLGTERSGGPALPHWKEGLAGYLAERSVAA
jgi:dTDP-4-dehydrorhamnose reductase